MGKNPPVKPRSRREARKPTLNGSDNPRVSTRSLTAAYFVTIHCLQGRSRESLHASPSRSLKIT
eukprot:7488109-Alexandrium_andersonii.AAC.1